jgi:hypothetical protein
LSEHDTVDVLYSDDDKIYADGKRFAPQFKPDWSPELLLSYMYFSHLFVVRKALFEEVSGFRPGFEGSQDYDRLRVTERPALSRTCPIYFITGVCCGIDGREAMRNQLALKLDVEPWPRHWRVAAQKRMYFGLTGP